MAVVSWGAYEGSNGLRVGLLGSWSTPSNGSTTATLTVSIYTQNEGRYNDPQVLTYGGSAGSGSTSFTNDSSGGAVLRATKTYTYTYSTYGTSPGSVSFSAAISGAYNGATPSHSLSFAIPARPYGLPTAPSAVTNTRNSDSQATVNWTRNATTGKPYTSQTVAMRTFTGSAWSSWSYSVVVSSTATSYVKTGLVANRLYQFEVRANNSVGSSAYVAAPASVVMTPAAPSNVASAISASGATITTTWTSNAYVLVSPIPTHTVQRSVNGGAFATVASGLTATSWTDPTPGGGTNRYQVATSISIGPLTSAYVAGNTVSTIVPPLAPTNLSPNGTAADFANTDVTLTWQHNPGGDQAPQTHFTIETSDDAGAVWDPLVTNVASSVSSYVIPAGTLANGVAYLWRVKTQGVATAAFGPFSAAATSAGSTTPTVTLVLPEAITTTTPLTIEWVYNQDEASPQTAWEAELYAADGATLLEALSGSDASTGASFAYPAVDGTTYWLRARARSGAGLWSAWVSAETAFNLLPPAEVHVAPEFQECTGTVSLDLTADAAVEDVTMAVDSVTIERRVNGGPWVVLVTGLPVPTTFVDTIPVTNGLNEYRVTAMSSAPSFFVGAPISAPGTDGGQTSGLWVFLTYGDAFSKSLRFRGDPKISESAGRVRGVQHFLGRKKPVLLVGVNVFRAVNVSGALAWASWCPDDDPCRWDSPAPEWLSAGQDAELVCLRDYTGRRVFGMLSDVSADDGVWPSKGAVSFSVTESEFTEVYGPWVEPGV